MKKSDIINEFLCTSGGIRLQLRRIKKDLDFDPWSTYRVSGDILFNIVQILEGKGE